MTGAAYTRRDRTRIFIVLARLDAELLSLRVERLTLPAAGAAVRKMQVGARMNAIRVELDSLLRTGAASG